jgi:hypothetical protein
MCESHSPHGERKASESERVRGLYDSGAGRGLRSKT